MLKKYAALIVASFIVIGGLTAFNTLNTVKSGGIALPGTGPTLQIRSFNYSNDIYAPGSSYVLFESCVYSSVTAEALIWTTHDGKKFAVQDEPITGRQFMVFPDSYGVCSFISEFASTPGEHVFNFSLMYDSFTTTHTFNIYSFEQLNPTLSNNQIDTNVSVWFNYTGSCIGSVQWMLNGTSIGSSSHLDYKFTKPGSYDVGLELTRGNQSVTEKPYNNVVNVSSDPKVNNLSYSNYTVCNSFILSACFSLNFNISGGTPYYYGYGVYLINNGSAPIYLGVFKKGMNTCKVNSYDIGIDGTGPYSIQIMVEDEYLTFTSGVLYVP